MRNELRSCGQRTLHDKIFSQRFRQFGARVGIFKAEHHGRLTGTSPRHLQFIMGEVIERSGEPFALQRSKTLRPRR